MKIKTSELTGAPLDWAVAKCEFPEPDYQPQDWMVYITEGCNDDGWAFKPSTDWAQAGALIEKEMVSLEWTGEDWMAYIWHDREYFGPTPLVAAMRCYVDHVIGDEVEVPHELAA